MYEKLKDTEQQQLTITLLTCGGVEKIVENLAYSADSAYRNSEVSSMW